MSYLFFFFQMMKIKVEIPLLLFLVCGLVPLSGGNPYDVTVYPVHILCFHYTSVCVWNKYVVIVLFIFKIYISDFSYPGVFFYNLLFSLNIFLSCIYLNCCIILIWLNVSQCIYPFPWAFRLLSHFHCCKYCSNECSWTWLLMLLWGNFSRDLLGYSVCPLATFLDTDKVALPGNCKCFIEGCWLK